jgi:hypothetical protein
MSYPTPEDAAREQIPTNFAHILAVFHSPDGRFAAVFLGTNEPPDIYPYVELCRKDGDGWVSDGGIDGAGWMSTSDPGDPVNVGVTVDYGEAPPDARSAIIDDGSGERRVSIVDGFYSVAIWNVPSDQPYAPGRGIKGFISR